VEPPGKQLCIRLWIKIDVRFPSASAALSARELRSASHVTVRQKNCSALARVIAEVGAFQVECDLIEQLNSPIERVRKRGHTPTVCLRKRSVNAVPYLGKKGIKAKSPYAFETRRFVATEKL